MSKAAELRAAITGPVPVLVAGVHDGLGARLAEEAGFSALWASGLAISASAAVPDASILTMTEFLAAATEMDRASRLPVIADCDSGFGNSNNVIHMVGAYAAAGIAAVCLEDKPFPKRNSFSRGSQPLASVAEFVGKLLAATAARRDGELLVIARTEALIAGHGLEAALERAEAYRRAGADAVLVHSKAGTPDEVFRFLAAWERRCPVVVVPTTYPQVSPVALKAAGADVVIYANQALRATVTAVAETFRLILAGDGGALAAERRIAPVQRIFELQGEVALAEQERRYLRGGLGPRAVVPAGGDLALPKDLAALVAPGAPRALLDLYGKPLVERQREAFTRAGVPELLLVGPFDAGQVPVPGVTVVTTGGGGMLATILAGLAVEAEPGQATIVCYSDILFGPEVVERLLGCDGDIAVLVDPGFRRARPRSGKRLDCVCCEPPPAVSNGSRRLLPERPARVVAIGKHIDAEDAHHEFIGLTLLSERGRRRVLECAARWAGPRRGQACGQAATFAAATWTDLLGELVAGGESVLAVEQEQGWLEIHDFDDYRAAIAELGRAGWQPREAAR